MSEAIRSAAMSGASSLCCLIEWLRDSASVARLCICGELAIALGAASGLPAAGDTNSHSPTSHKWRHKCEAKRKRADERKCQSKDGIKHAKTRPRPEIISKAAISGLIFATPSAEGLSERQAGPPTSVSDPGVLTVTDANTEGIIETLKVSAGSAGFRVVVTAGTYVLSGTDEAFPTASCAAETSTVTEGEQLSASIGCTEPSGERLCGRSGFGSAPRRRGSPLGEP